MTLENEYDLGNSHAFQQAKVPKQRRNLVSIQQVRFVVFNKKIINKKVLVDIIGVIRYCDVLLWRPLATQIGCTGLMCGIL